jgi:hypothetical protein
MTSISYSGLECGLKPHLYGTKSGEMKRFSSEKLQNIGYYIKASLALIRELRSRRFRCGYRSRKWNRQVLMMLTG